MSSSRYFKLGLFILLATAGLVAGMIALGADRMFAKSIMVQTTFDESIAGLEAGAAVKYRGVAIGHVQSIRFPEAADFSASPETFKYIIVEMAINSAAVGNMNEQQLKPTIQRMVKDGLRARLDQSGLTGTAFVNLNYLDPVSHPDTQPPFKTDAIYVPSAPGAFNQVVDGVTDIVSKLQQAHVDQVVSNVNTLILHLDDSVQKLRVADFRAKLDPTLDHLQTISARIDDLLKNGHFDQSAAHLRNTLAQSDELLASQSDNLRAILTDLRATAANARELSEEVKANPSRLIVNEPPPRTAFGGSR